MKWHANRRIEAEKRGEIFLMMAMSLIKPPLEKKMYVTSALQIQ
jgi:hypothetical protein